MSQTPQPQQSAQPSRPRRRRRRIPWYRKPGTVVTLIGLIIAVLAIIFNFPKIQHAIGLDNPNTTSTPIPAISPTPTISSPDPLQQATKGTLTLNDPLTVPK